MAVTELLDVIFAVFTTVAMNVTDFLNVTPCTLVDGRYIVSWDLSASIFISDLVLVIYRVRQRIRRFLSVLKKLKFLGIVIQLHL